ncbi:MAG: selenium cofactor biosynthesis protein YqeC [Coriobacteriales bacterium]|nr:selenium cofactor biosynthesis protein YqeC [Coriobacteriales bacterium]
MGQLGSSAQPISANRTRPSSPASLEEMCGGAHIIAVIGSGGKTTFIETLARQLRRSHPSSVVAISTTTRQWPPSQLPLVANQTADGAMSRLARLGVAYVADTCPARGTGAAPSSGAAPATGAADSPTAAPLQNQIASNTSAVKLCEPSWGIDRLASDVVAGGGYLLIEADGSRGLPLKAHADWEPVVPPSTQRCILMVGAAGFGRPVGVAAHRPELFCSRAGCSLESAASPERVADEIASEIECGALHFDVAFVNQVDSGRDEASLAPQAPQTHLTPAQPCPTKPRPCPAQDRPRPAQVHPRSTPAEVFAFTTELRKKGISAPVWFGSARTGVAMLVAVE